MKIFLTLLRAQMTESDFIYLLLGAICMNDINIYALVHQLMKQLPRSIYRLDKHQHRRQETLKHTIHTH